MTDWIIQDSRPPEHIDHASTQAALAAMHRLAGYYASETILDIGCGSGVLTLAAAELWPAAQLTACDISLQAVTDCQANIERHGLTARVLVQRSNGVSAPNVQENGPYDLLLCNLLAETLVGQARAFAALVKPKGALVLSGILPWRLAQVKAAYNLLHIEIEQEFFVDGWYALLARRLT